MSVEIDPAELGFHRPFTVEVAQVLKIKNPNTAPVAFKVKTTAPKQYCVRPNSGRIEPGADVEVSVLLQAMKQEPPPDARCRDKFLVQSVTITGDKEFTNVAQIWDSVDKSSVQERKIRVNWLPSGDSAHSDSTFTPVRKSLSNGVEATPEVPPAAYSSPSEDNTSMPAAVSEPETREVKPDTGVKAEPSAASASKTAVDSSVDYLKEKLADAEATIATLKNEAASGLRQRKTGSDAEKDVAPSSAGSLAQTARQGTEGVPIQIVAALCFISFLLAYFFF